MYRIKPLIEYCRNSFALRIKKEPKDTFKTWQNAFDHFMVTDELEHSVWSVLTKSGDAIKAINHPSFFELSPDLLERVLRSNYTKVKEWQLFLRTVGWAKQRIFRKEKVAYFTPFSLFLGGKRRKQRKKKKKEEGVKMTKKTKKKMRQGPFPTTKKMKRLKF